MHVCLRVCVHACAGACVHVHKCVRVLVFEDVSVSDHVSVRVGCLRFGSSCTVPHHSCRFACDASQQCRVPSFMRARDLHSRPTSRWWEAWEAWGPNQLPWRVAVGGSRWCPTTSTAARVGIAPAQAHRGFGKVVGGPGVNMAKCMRQLETIRAKGQNCAGTLGVHSRAGDMVVVDETVR